MDEHLFDGTQRNRAQIDASGHERIDCLNAAASKFFECRRVWLILFHDEAFPLSRCRRPWEDEDVASEFPESLHE
jgi:hypothetical protein